MSVRIVLASHNPGKLVELRRILAEAAPGVALVGLDALPPYEPSPETGLTFAENALAKAREACSHSGLPAVADDSGLVVDALNGMPGVFSARWAGRHGDDEANLNLLLGQLADVSDSHRGAAFVCAAAIVLPDGRQECVEGRVEGAVIREPRGSNGFGYDPIFCPRGEGRTTAEMSRTDKDAISHRGKAFRSLAVLMSDLLHD